MTNTIFRGRLKIRVPSQNGLSRAQRALVKRAYHDGVGIPQQVRYSCAIAMAVNEAIKNGVMVDGVSYQPNPKVRAQFGKNKRDLPYLTFGLIDPKTGEPHTLTWEGASNIPVDMIDIAVKHDEGEKVPAKQVSLSLADAKVYETGNEDGKGRNKRDRRKNHDTAKNGKPYPRAPRPNHNRLCRADVLKVLREMRKLSALSG